ncbi:MAG: ABC transporter permease [Bacillota bacterium]
MLGRIASSSVRSGRAGNAPFLLIISIALMLIAGAIAPGFLSPANVLNTLRQAVPLGIISIGQTMAILTGGVDLSLGAVAILSNVLAANIMSGEDANNLRALVVCSIVALLIGVMNGLGITRVGINPFVMTLAMGIIVHGAALVYSKGAAGGAASPLTKFLATGRMGIVPVAVVVWVLFAVATLVMLEYTVLGRRIYAVGSNRETARMSGINVNSIIIAVYTMSSFAAMITGLLVTGYIGVGTLEWGMDYRLTSMAAVVMGGTTFEGGRGGYLGTLGAVLAITVLNNLLTILRISQPVRQIFYGLVVLFFLISSLRGAKEE